MTVKQCSTHADAGRNWALVLAAGEGSRLQSLTTTASGIAIPKQFCSLHGGPSLLHDALQRAAAVAPPERTCVIVAEHHHRWWRSLPASIPADNVIVQPRNRGTAIGILLPLLRIMQRDPGATLLVLPSDHSVRDENTLAAGLRRCVQVAATARDDSIILLGFEPGEADSELGYVVPDGAADAGVQRVRQFMEKPSAASARTLIGRGGLWNSFIFSAHGAGLLQVFERYCAENLAQLRIILDATGLGAAREPCLAELYERLPVVDFSRDILARALPQLRVMAVPACGWSDLGTPRRVGMALASRRPARIDVPLGMHAAGFLNLAAQHARLQSGLSGAPA